MKFMPAMVSSYLHYTYHHLYTLIIILYRITFSDNASVDSPESMCSDDAAAILKEIINEGIPDTPQNSICHNQDTTAVD